MKNLKTAYDALDKILAGELDEGRSLIRSFIKESIDEKVNEVKVNEEEISADQVGEFKDEVEAPAEESIEEVDKVEIINDKVEAIADKLSDAILSEAETDTVKDEKLQALVDANEELQKAFISDEADKEAAVKDFDAALAVVEDAGCEECADELAEIRIQIDSIKEDEGIESEPSKAVETSDEEIEVEESKEEPAKEEIKEEVCPECGKTPCECEKEEVKEGVEEELPVEEVSAEEEIKEVPSEEPEVINLDDAEEAVEEIVSNPEEVEALDAKFKELITDSEEAPAEEADAFEPEEVVEGKECGDKEEVKEEEEVPSEESSEEQLDESVELKKVKVPVEKAVDAKSPMSEIPENLKATFAEIMDMAKAGTIKKQAPKYKVENTPNTGSKTKKVSTK